MYFIIKKNTKVFIAVLLVVIVAVAFAVRLMTKSYSYAISDQNRTVVLDAGHGGVDGGASSHDGALEKDINLAILLKLKTLLVLNGYDVITTRETDISIHDEDSDTIRRKKVSDMKKRLQITDDASGIFVSIHQNQFPNEKYSGAQMFFGMNNPQSPRLADCIQSSFAKTLQKNNKREIKKATKSLFLLYQTKVPAVIVECGFMSNPKEADLLQQDEYQKKLAIVIFNGISEYYKG